MTMRTEAQKRAEAEYRAGLVQVLVRLTPDEAQALDRARGDLSRAAYLRTLLPVPRTTT
jgi:hypothetical protein